MCSSGSRPRQQAVPLFFHLPVRCREEAEKARASVKAQHTEAMKALQRDQDEALARARAAHKAALDTLLADQESAVASRRAELLAQREADVAKLKADTEKLKVQPPRSCSPPLCPPSLLDAVIPRAGRRAAAGPAVWGTG